MIQIEFTGEAGSSEPNPTPFPGPTLWIDGTSTSLPGLADSGSVGLSTNWIDRVTGTQNFSQGTSTNQPTLHQTGGPNNKPYVSFDANDSMVFSANWSGIITASAYTIFAVIRPQRDGANDSAWFCPQIIGTINGWDGLSLRNTGSGNKFSLWQDRGSGFGSPNAASVESTTSFSQNVWYIVEAWWDGTNMNIRVNQDTVSSLPFNNPQFLSFVPSMGMQSDIAALYVWNTHIGSTNRDTFRASLSSWFGITVP